MFDMFYFLEDCDVVNDTDDSTPYCAGKSAEFVVNNLEQSSPILFQWLNSNCMKVNTVKSHLLLSGNSRAASTFDSRGHSKSTHPPRGGRGEGVVQKRMKTYKGRKGRGESRQRVVISQYNTSTIQELLKKTALFQYITEICKFWQWKCLKFTEVCLQKF